MPTATADPPPSARDRPEHAAAIGEPWNRAVPAASFTAFRVAFGTLVVVGQIRFLLRGWVDEFYLAPTAHLTYPRFEWVRPLPAPLMYGVVGGLALAGLAIAFGRQTRVAAALFVIGFAYTELIDAALYLNHYWFMTLAALVLAIVPGPRSGSVQVATIWALRIQLAVVYVFAGLAKINEDWLLRGEPLTTWLAARTDRPVIGPLLDEPIVGLVFSWAGAAFDLTIVGWLLWRRSRPIAYAFLVVFHLITAMLFQIGMFPWVMILLTPIFFAPDWPGRLTSTVDRLTGAGGAAPPDRTDRVRRLGRPTCALLAVLAAFNLTLPLRHLAADGNVRWNDDGYVASWRVMLTERASHVRFQITDPAARTTEVVDATAVLTDWQAAAAMVRADLILTTAHLLADDRESEAGQRPEMRVDAHVAWNGRVRVRWIDPHVDLAALPRTAPASDYVLSAP